MTWFLSDALLCKAVLHGLFPFRINPEMLGKMWIFQMCALTTVTHIIVSPDMHSSFLICARNHKTLMVFGAGSKIGTFPSEY